MLTKIATRFIRREDGSMTALGLFILLTCFVIGGLALDVAVAYKHRTELQAAADAVAHAAIYNRVTTFSADEARYRALEVAEAMLPYSKYGTTLTADNIQFGKWDAATRTFEHDDYMDDAVFVDISQIERKGNPVSTFFLRFAGFNNWNIRRGSVFETYIPTCFREGFVAEERVDMQSNNIYSKGFCIHSNTVVEMNSSNEYADNTVVSMPDERDVVTPGGELSSNPGLSGALRDGSYIIRILNQLPGIISALGDGTYHNYPDYIDNPVDVIYLNRSQFNVNDIQDGKVYNIHCNGSQPMNFSASVTLRDVIIATNCGIHFAADAFLRDSIIATTNTGDKSVYAGANITIGHDDNCGSGGDSQILTMGSVELTAGVEMFGSQIVAMNNIYLTSNAVGIEGASLIAGGEISVTSNGSMGFCGGEGMTRNFEAEYFRMVN